MSIIRDIVETIQDITKLKPVYKGGTRTVPIEYEYHRTDLYTYKLSIYIHNTDALKVEELSDQIVSGLNSFGDNRMVKDKINGYVEMQAGGSFAKDNIVTNTLIFKVVSWQNPYNHVTPPDPPTPPIKSRKHMTYPEIAPFEFEERKE